MAQTSTAVSDLAETIVAKYESDYLVWAEKTSVWGQLVDWQDPIPQDGGGGSSFDWPVFHEIPPATTALTETDDVDTVILGDSNATVTPYEYGNAVKISRKARFQSRANLRTAIAEVVGQNQAHTVDYLIRTAAIGGSWVHRPGGGVRTDMDTTNDLPTFDYISEIVAQARQSFIAPFDGNMYASVVHSLTAKQLRAMAQWSNPTYYQDQLHGQLMKGEIGSLAGVRFIEHPYGKLYLSGGTTAQAATTLAASVAAGATSMTVATSTGLAAGDYITVGTLETTAAEMVRVTANSGVSLTIQGIGNTFGNFGFANSHANALAVTEAANVGAIPIIGRQSIRGVYGQTTGRLGEATVVQGAQAGDLLGRFLTLGWYWYGGLGALEKYIIRGEAAVSGGVIGTVFNN